MTQPSSSYTKSICISSFSWNLRLSWAHVSQKLIYFGIKSHAHHCTIGIHDIHRGTNGFRNDQFQRYFYEHGTNKRTTKKKWNTNKIVKYANQHEFSISTSQIASISIFNRREENRKKPMPMSLVLLDRMCSEYSFQMWNKKGKKKTPKTENCFH